MDEQNQKAMAVNSIGQVATPRRPRCTEPRELRIEQLDGGFVVMTADQNRGDYARQVIPDADCLLSFVQKWTHER